MKEISLQNYNSTYAFVFINSLDKEAEKCLGRDWEAEDDVNQIQDLLLHVGRKDLLVRLIENLPEDDIEVYSKQESVSLGDIKDLAVRITGNLVLQGLVKDCTDTDDSTEDEVQDEIELQIALEFGYTQQHLNNY